MAIRASMNVSVTPQLERFVQEQVESGRYHSASEVFRDGLRLLKEAENRRLLEKWLAEGLTSDEERKLPSGLLAKARSQIQAKIQQGLDELDRGEFVDGPEFMAQWKRRLTAMRAKQKSPRRVKRKA